MALSACVVCDVTAVAVDPSDEVGYLASCPRVLFGLVGSKATQEEPEEEQVPMEPSREKPMEE